MRYLEIRYVLDVPHRNGALGVELRLATVAGAVVFGKAFRVRKGKRPQMGGIVGGVGGVELCVCATQEGCDGRHVSLRRTRLRSVFLRPCVRDLALVSVCAVPTSFQRIKGRHGLCPGHDLCESKMHLDASSVAFFRCCEVSHVAKVQC